MHLKVLIIEDEHLGIERLERHIHAIDSGIEVVGTADSVSASVKWLSSHTAPDLILMDIDLGDGQSFDIFNEVPVDCPVVFTTSYDEKALNAFAINNIDYLLKPVKKLELKGMLEKYNTAGLNGPARKRTNVDGLVQELRQQLHPREYRQRFLVREGKKLKSIEVHEISYFYTDGSQYFVKTCDNRKFQLEYSLDDLEHMLDPDRFFRINELYIACQTCILQVHEYFKGRIRVSLLCGENKEIFIDKHRIQPFKAWMAGKR
jgi:DNA-binding LytR/AlgR family response regulator